jgi:hypothetical protein
MPQLQTLLLRKRKFNVVSQHENNAYEAYLFTFKAEEWEEFDEFLEKWSANHGTTEEWSSGPSKSIPSGVPIFLMKQGKAPTGIIAAGFTASENHPSKRWSKRKKRMVPGRANTLRFTHFLDPANDKLLDINNLPRKYWASMASGVGLPPELFRDIKSRWNILLGENSNEKEKAQKAPTLDEDDAADDYEINDKDTRATALKQIKERRGQNTFRQKMLDTYGDRCSISGCRVVGVLEAAHIKSYLGQNDQKPQNGLLLRADLHTLFDLFLLGINPKTKCIHLHPSLHGSEYGKFQGEPLRRAKILPSFDALRLHWRVFKEKSTSAVT